MLNSNGSRTDCNIVQWTTEQPECFRDASQSTHLLGSLGLRGLGPRSAPYAVRPCDVTTRSMLPNHRASPRDFDAGDVLRPAVEESKAFWALGSSAQLRFHLQSAGSLIWCTAN